MPFCKMQRGRRMCGICIAEAWLVLPGNDVFVFFALAMFSMLLPVWSINARCFFRSKWRGGGSLCQIIFLGCLIFVFFKRASALYCNWTGVLVKYNPVCSCRPVEPSSGLLCLSPSVLVWPALFFLQPRVSSLMHRKNVPSTVGQLSQLMMQRHRLVQLVTFGWSGSRQRWSVGPNGKPDSHRPGA